MENKKDLVGIVIVSHNKALVQEIINFCKMIQQSDFNIENGGGTDSEGIIYGSTPKIVAEAIKRADKGAGVLIFVDMGTSILSAEEAIKELKGQIDARIVNAPIVEGAISAVAGNFDGITIDELADIAEESRYFNKTSHKDNH